MKRIHTNDHASPQLSGLALIWPHDPHGGMVAGILLLDETARRSMAAGGDQVVTAVRQHAICTHVVAEGRQD